MAAPQGAATLASVAGPPMQDLPISRNAPRKEHVSTGVTIRRDACAGHKRRCRGQSSCPERRAQWIVRGGDDRRHRDRHLGGLVGDNRRPPMDSATASRHRPANWKASMGIRFVRALNKGYPRALYAGERDAARGRKKALGRAWGAFFAHEVGQRRKCPPKGRPVLFHHASRARMTRCVDCPLTAKTGVGLIYPAA